MKHIVNIEKGKAVSYVREDEIIDKIKLYFAKCMQNKRVPREEELLKSLGEKDDRTKSN